MCGIRTTCTFNGLLDHGHGSGHSRYMWKRHRYVPSVQFSDCVCNVDDPLINHFCSHAWNDTLFFLLRSGNAHTTYGRSSNRQHTCTHTCLCWMMSQDDLSWNYYDACTHKKSTSFCQFAKSKWWCERDTFLGSATDKILKLNFLCVEFDLTTMCPIRDAQQSKPVSLLESIDRFCTLQSFIENVMLRIRMWILSNLLSSTQYAHIPSRCQLLPQKQKETLQLRLQHYSMHIPFFSSWPMLNSTSFRGEIDTATFIHFRNSWLKSPYDSIISAECSDSDAIHNWWIV